MTTNGDPPEPEGFVLPETWSAEARKPIRFVLPEASRPWNWLDLDHDQAAILWRVLGEFVGYLNRRYIERAEQRLPPCWAEHGSLVEELTTLFFARWHAFESEHASIGGAQFWHTYTLPGFLDRMGRFIGPDRLRRCQAGRHEERVLEEPAEAEHWKRRRGEIEQADTSLRRPGGGPGPEDDWAEADLYGTDDWPRDRRLRRQAGDDDEPDGGG